MSGLNENFFKIDESKDYREIDCILAEGEQVLWRGKPKKSAFILVIIGMCVFFLFHLLPVWIWISHVITANRQHKNLEYAFTDKRIVVKSGIVGIDFKNIYYADITSVNLKVGLIDRICKVGDIYIKGKESAAVLYDLENCYFIVNKLQEIVLDLKTDTYFPNDLRPKTNRGFRTKYTKE